MDSKAAIFEHWYQGLKEKDPVLYEELAQKLESRMGGRNDESASPQERVVTESVYDPRAPDDPFAIALETIVREGRPAFPIKHDLIEDLDALPDASAAVIRDRLMAAKSVIEPLLPLVGRIDSVNHPRSLPFLGTAWLIKPGIAVTNRHVAELMAQRDGGRFVFRPGRFGERLNVSIDYKHELDNAETATVRVLEVLFIETDPNKADIAFLRVEDSADGRRRRHFSLATGDVAPGAEVAVIGYPARAPAYVIPDQTWMDQIYGGTYDVKRIAPGLMQEQSRGWATHDCTTLGGNSGSVVVDMRSGEAVGLHFAGLYMVENYAVPASVISDYINRSPWNGGGGSRPRGPERREGSARAATSATPPSASVTFPLTVTVTIGDPVVDQSRGSIQFATGPDSASIETAAAALLRELRLKGALAVRAGHRLSREGLEDQLCLVVAVAPEAVQEFDAPADYVGFPVEVRAASIQDQLAAEAIVSEAPQTVAYNDDERLGAGFRFDWIEEPMQVVCHVGPERSWTELRKFLLDTRKSLVSSMYEFHAAHIAAAIEQELTEATDLTLVLARQSRDPRNGEIKDGEFSRREAFDRWQTNHRENFRHVFVPIGANGLCASSYHIKVSVRDGDTVWLSSGNWRRTSQPLIQEADLDDPARTSAAGNREWHAIVASPTLAERFANHINADFEFSSVHPEAVSMLPEDEVMVDVPIELAREGILLEGPPGKVMDPLRIDRTVRVKTLLTPDHKGDVYCDAVLDLIRSARRQLVFQNQYMHATTPNGTRLDGLIDAIVEKAGEIDDCRIIVRREGDTLRDDVSALKRRGFPVATNLRALSKTHTKGIVVDGERVLVGSHNWSASGVTLNRDASLIFDDPEIARYYLEAFELDWERARPVTLDNVIHEAPRLARGERPPPGFMRMPLAEFLEG